MADDSPGSLEPSHGVFALGLLAMIVLGFSDGGLHMLRWGRLRHLGVLATGVLFIGIMPLVAAAAAVDSDYLDGGFGDSGVVRLDERHIPYDVIVQADRKPVLLDVPLGTDYFRLTRLTETGVIDTTFGNAGTTGVARLGDTPAETRALHTDSFGNLFVSAPTTGGVEIMKFAPSGQVDTSYGTNGKATVIFSSDPVYESVTKLTGDGSILFASAQEIGSRIGKIDPDGSLDQAFGVAGVTDLLGGLSISQMDVLADGRIIGVGRQWPSGKLVAVMVGDTGIVDASFGTNGVYEFPPELSAYGVTDSMADAVGLLVLFNDYETGTVVTRLSPTGGPDLGFGVGGSVYTGAGLGVSSRLAATESGKVVVADDAGGFRLVITLMSADGQIEKSFGGDGSVEVEVGPRNAFFHAVAVDGKDRVVMASHLWTGVIESAAVRVLLSPIVDTFTDDDDSIFEPDIEWLAVSGITKGCNPPTNDLFCPFGTVTRGQMAAFLHRALPDLPEIRPAIDFMDDDASIFEVDIEWLYSRGVTQGTSATTFGPDRPVTRGQMAAFLVRALKYSDNGGGDLFIDDDTSQFEGDIDRLGTAGVTRGCNPPTNDRFCPDGFVTRGQMAAFLHRALGG